ncbi:MAG: thiolase family protein [Saprospiraceae bacterium]|nr:thiolase family protein [Saprospiraceae bacterium]
MKEVYIVAAKRTPIGSFGGHFAGVSAVQLGAYAIQSALNTSGVEATNIDEVLFGNVVSANLGQAPARQAAKGADIPDNVPCTTVNKVCSSGLKSAMFGAQSIELEQNALVMTGGMENMSQIPYYLPKARFGYKFGSGNLVDGMEKDGLRDVYDQCAMGVCGDQTAAKYKVSREDQDQYAMESYRRSANATEHGHFKDEIVPISITQRKGDPLVVAEDEEFRRVKFEKIPSLRPAFSKDGTVTAANASTINDGAAAVLLASKDAVEQFGLTPLARIASYADAAQEPAFFTTAPTLAAPKALQRAGLSWADIDLIEVNEAFAVVPLVFASELELDMAKINVHGGAVSLGHPLGASGARILVTLIHALKTHKGRYGLAAICNGGGGASAMVVENLS